MSDPKDVARPRSPLTLSPKSPKPATSKSTEEQARKLYGNTGEIMAEHAKALAKALRAGSEPKPLTDEVKALAAALRGEPPATVLNDTEGSPYDLGTFGEPNAGPGMARLGLGGSLPLSEIMGAFPKQDFGDATDVYQRFTLKRDRDRPLAFDGRIRAEVEEHQFDGQVVIRAAIYETQGGKFVTEMTRREINPPVNYGSGKRPFLFAKASVFDSLDIAAMSFRTHGGRLTELLLKQIGDVDPEFIE